MTSGKAIYTGESLYRNKKGGQAPSSIYYISLQLNWIDLIIEHDEVLVKGAVCY